MQSDGFRKAPVKARINFWVDALIGVAFLVAAVSGVVLLVMGSGGGHRGGRGTGAVREVWRDLHDWSGITMTVGVLGHLLLHAKWIGAFSRRVGAKDCPVEVIS